jgi:hypothetical protein
MTGPVIVGANAEHAEQTEYQPILSLLHSAGLVGVKSSIA